MDYLFAVASCLDTCYDDTCYLGIHVCVALTNIRLTSRVEFFFLSPSGKPLQAAIITTHDIVYAVSREAS